MSFIKPNTLNTQYFTNHPKEESFVIDLQDDVSALSQDVGADYVSAQDWRVKNGASFSPDAQDVREHRKDDAKTKVIATFPTHATDDLPDITAGGMIIKRSGTMHLALPDVFETSLPKIHAAAQNVLQLGGAEYFKNSEMTLVVQRTDIEPQQAHRPHFAHWHNHSEKGENADLVFLWHDVMGTEHRVEGQEVVAPDNVLTRMGGEQEHRSQTNDTDEKVHREWGALVVKSEAQKPTRSSNYMSENHALYVGRDDPLFGEFSDAAQAVLEQNSSFHILDDPQDLAEFVSDQNHADIG